MDFSRLSQPECHCSGDCHLSHRHRLLMESRPDCHQLPLAANVSGRASEFWAAIVLLVAGAMVPALRRGLPAMGWMASSLLVPIAIPILHNQELLIRWTMVAAPFILINTA